MHSQKSSVVVPQLRSAGGERASIWPGAPVCVRCQCLDIPGATQPNEKIAAHCGTHEDDLAQWFSDERIQTALVRKRAKLARKRGDTRPEWLFASRYQEPTGDDARLIAIFPTRRELHRLRTPQINKLTSDKALEIMLFRAIRLQKYVLREKLPKWHLNLDGFIAEIRSRALEEATFEFTSQNVIAKKKGKNKYRPLVTTNLVESVISSLVAGYLRAHFNPDWDPCSFAFREPATHLIGEHHGAFESLVAFRNRFPETVLWVAEIDIQAFFDCVGHDMIRKCLHKATNLAALRGRPVSERAMHILDALLQSYDFRSIVLGIAAQELSRTHPGATFSWPEAALKALHPDFAAMKFGIPQGNALSNVVANLILDNADRAVKKAFTPGQMGNIFYVRFCDDMLVASPTQALADRAFSAYNNALFRLGLAAHPSRVPAARHDKTKQPYPWQVSGKGTGWEWVEFLGYGLRYDGQTRIREASVAKHKSQIISKIDRFITAVIQENPSEEHCNTQESRQLLKRAIRHLIASTVGRESPWSDSPRPVKACWMGGFRQLRANPSIFQQLRRLDRFRHGQVQHLAKLLKDIFKLPQSIKKGRISRTWKFPGAPLSYLGQVMGKGKKR